MFTRFWHKIKALPIYTKGIIGGVVLFLIYIVFIRKSGSTASTATMPTTPANTASITDGATGTTQAYNSTPVSNTSSYSPTPATPYQYSYTAPAPITYSVPSVLDQVLNRAGVSYLTNSVNKMINGNVGSNNYSNSNNYGTSFTAADDAWAASAGSGNVLSANPNPYQNTQWFNPNPTGEEYIANENSLFF